MLWRFLASLGVLAVVLMACHAGNTSSTGAAAAAPAMTSPAAPPAPPLRVATFAGGCFWCMEPPFEKLDGVVSVVSGFTGGPERNPTYEQVSSGSTRHAESVQITYDPAKVKYEDLLKVYWHNVDPTVSHRQFCDVGHQYRPVIFVHDAEQRRLAEESKRAIEASGQIKAPLVVPIENAGDFWPAEEYHQDFYKKNPLRYKTYRAGCGRDVRLAELWGEAASQH